MGTYLIHDAETGDVVHVHHEPVGMHTAREEILELAGPHRGRRLEVFEVPDGRLPGHAVRVQDGRLVAAEGDAALGNAGASSGFDQPTGERRYDRLASPE